MRLPRTAREIADVIGRERALYLIGQLPRAYCGHPGKQSHRVILYVPKRLPPTHNLVRILGWHDALKLSRHFPGQCLQPANCIDVYRDFRDRSMIRMFLDDGLNARTLAELFGVSERHVTDLLRTIPQVELPKPMAQPARNRKGRKRHGKKPV